MLEFKYRKKNGEIRDVELHLLTYTDKAIEGLDLTKMTESQRIYLAESIKVYDECISHLKKVAYRRFLHLGIQEK